jgi:hypothetical protein
MSAFSPVLCAVYRIRQPVAEYRFHPTRKWRFDYAWPEVRLALEVQGGIWTGGRHVRGGALLKEWEKINTAATLGWRVMYCQPQDIRSFGRFHDLLTEIALAYHNQPQKP